MFVILFGLSMDYHVFILSRVREAFDRGMSTEDAVAHGIKTTAGVVSSAALVMVGVFSIFATLPIIDMKEMGIGLAAAVLIDATIVRAVLLPATMKLLGDWNWYLPSWLALAAEARGPRRDSSARRPRRSRLDPSLVEQELRAAIAAPERSGRAGGGAARGRDRLRARTWDSSPRSSSRALGFSCRGCTRPPRSRGAADGAPPS